MDRERPGRFHVLKVTRFAILITDISLHIIIPAFFISSRFSFFDIDYI